LSISVDGEPSPIHFPFFSAAEKSSPIGTHRALCHYLAANISEGAKLLIAFDYDGVIADTFERIFDVICAAQRRIGEGRVPERNDLRTIVNMTFPDFARKVGISERNVEQFADAALEEQGRRTDMPEIFPGIAEVIQTVSPGNNIVTISSSSEEEISRLLEAHGLRAHIEAIGDGSDRRPKSEKLVTFMDRFGVTPEQTVMIGDSRSDIVQGKLAKARTIAVTWGFQPELTLKAEAPDAVAHSPEELLAILESLPA